MKYIIAPSILSADFGNLQRDIEMINQSEADWFHVDVMDGVFVPNISFGFPVMAAVKKYATKPLDVHLMIVDPDKYIEDFAKAGADRITVHYEACTHLHRTIQLIKASGCKAGVALNPHTPVTLLQDIIEDLDLVLIMSVNPGFGGQTFIHNTYKKIKDLKTLIQGVNENLIVEIDGGVGLQNIATLVAAGANAFVAGNAIFATDNPTETISKMKSLTASTINI
ncbi:MULTISPECIES: ribulose-phosphate 3-epimerase [unclassified Pedobacter]|uniref:ribulose-phosphate 3-epimerase n=1 Tax=unclassified Pedobacter TaxID=2628915 RepID=UPI001423DEA1|nr:MULTISPECIES: ribulose-phosphate 3-epimerase [unclassified Pedobacter]NII82973.1 ribulose-phosphate 3-epimerase [Pedobacter sp. SG908]NMN36991.1 ribulose-phosphate 3-epimerase [Pedobacter sp. SG918]